MKNNFSTRNSGRRFTKQHILRKCQKDNIISKHFSPSGILNILKIRIRLSSQNLPSWITWQHHLPTLVSSLRGITEKLPPGSRMYCLSIGFLNHTPNTITKRFKKTGLINLSRRHDEKTNAQKEHKVLPIPTGKFD